MVGTSFWYLLTLVVGMLVSGAAGGSWGVCLWILFFAFAYGMSLRLHPYRACWVCQGSGKHRALFFKGTFRSCAVCGGSGKHIRWGVRVFNIKQ